MKRCWLLLLVGCATDDLSIAESAATLDENGQLWMEGGSPQEPAVWRQDASASNGWFVEFPEVDAGRVSHTFHLQEEAALYVWARVIAPSSVFNSVFVGFDRQELRWEVPATPAWTWRPITNLDGTRWRSRTLSATQHQLTFWGDEAGFRIDRVMVTTDADFVPVFETVQAESATLVAPMRSVMARTAPPVTYIWVPNGAGSYGAAHLPFDIPHPGDYHVWGRFEAPTEVDNSIYFHALGQPREVWEVDVATDWRWDRFDRPITLAGAHTYVVTQREDGTKLDKLVLTNDAGFSYGAPPAPPVKSQ